MTSRYPTYDDKGIFSPRGNLLQVEYAFEIKHHSAPGVGIVAKDGIVLASLRRKPLMALQQTQSNDKLFTINANTICMVAGYSADGRILVRHAREAAQRHLLTRNVEIPCRHLVRTVCSLKQAYTQHGSLRPFGSFILFAGWDPQNQFQLYRTDPAACYIAWKATTIGDAGSNYDDLLLKHYDENMDLKRACLLAVFAFQSMEGSSTIHDRLEIATLEQTEGGRVSHRIWSRDEIISFIGAAD